MEAAVGNLSWDCWAYKNGKPDKNIKVVAGDRSEAEALAWQKFERLGVRPEKITVK